MFALLISLALPAHAYHVEMHGDLTREAADRVALCVGEWQEEWTDTLVKHNRKQDAYTIERGANWHFYDPGGELRTGPFFHRNLNRVYRRRKRDLADRIGDGDLDKAMKATGAVLHYVQDMAVPLHVVPVFHVSGAPYENTDYDGDIPAGLDCDGLALALAALEDRCPDARCVAQEVLDATARETGRVVARPPWDAYWVPNGERRCVDAQLDGAGKKRRDFGCAGPALWGDGDIDEENSLYGAQLARAVDASALLLMWTVRTLKM